MDQVRRHLFERQHKNRKRDGTIPMSSLLYKSINVNYDWKFEKWMKQNIIYDNNYEYCIHHFAVIFIENYLKSNVFM